MLIFYFFICFISLFSTCLHSFTPAPKFLRKILAGLLTPFYFVSIRNQSPFFLFHFRILSVSFSSSTICSPSFSSSSYIFLSDTFILFFSSYPSSSSSSSSSSHPTAIMSTTNLHRLVALIPQFVFIIFPLVGKAMKIILFATDVLSCRCLVVLDHSSFPF